MTILENDIEKLKIQGLLTKDLAEQNPNLIDLALNSEHQRLAWMLALEDANSKLKKLKSWQIRKRLIILKGRADAINRLGSIAQISLATSERETYPPPKI